VVCLGTLAAPDKPVLVELSVENTSAGFPAISKHSVRKGDPDVN